jgi:hypothetical protein
MKMKERIFQQPEQDVIKDLYKVIECIYPKAVYGSEGSNRKAKELEEFLNSIECSYKEADKIICLANEYHNEGEEFGFRLGFKLAMQICMTGAF